MPDELLGRHDAGLEGGVFRIGREEALDGELGEGVLLVAFGDEVRVDLHDGGIEDLLLDRHMRGEIVGELDDERRLLGPAVFELLEDGFDFAVLLLEEVGGVHDGWRQQASRQERHCARANVV